MAREGLLLVAISGCCPKCGEMGLDHCADFPPGAIPPPAGTYACQWQTAQQAGAEDDDFVFYQHEWYRGGTELGPGGQRHLQSLAERLLAEPRAVCIEPQIDPEQPAKSRDLDQARVVTMVNHLAELGVPNAGQRVIVQASQALPLMGHEAARLGTSRLGGGRGATGGTGSLGGGGGGMGGGGSTAGNGMGGGY